MTEYSNVEDRAVEVVEQQGRRCSAPSGESRGPELLVIADVTGTSVAGAALEQLFPYPPLALCSCAPIAKHSAPPVS